METKTNIKAVFNQPSGFIRYNEEGTMIVTKQVISPWCREINISTKLGNKIGYHIDNPSKLPEDVKHLIVDSFYSVALSAFSLNHSKQFQEDVFHHLFDVDILVLVFNDEVGYGQDEEIVERGIAFRTYSVFNEEGKKFAYIEGTAVDPAFQGYGFYQGFTQVLINENDFDYITSRTQNPVVITALNRVFTSVAPITRVSTEVEKKICSFLADRLKMNGSYNENLHTGKGTYGKRLNGIKPRIDSEISNKLNELIDVEAGDCIIAICES